MVIIPIAIVASSNIQELVSLIMFSVFVLSMLGLIYTEINGYYLNRCRKKSEIYNLRLLNIDKNLGIGSDDMQQYSEPKLFF